MLSLTIKDCTCNKLGKTLAFTQIEFFDSKQRMFARGSHTKYIANAFEHVCIDDRSVFDLN